MSLLQVLDGQTLEGLKEEQEIFSEMDRSSDIKMNIQETFFSIWFETKGDKYFWRTL